MYVAYYIFVYLLAADVALETYYLSYVVGNLDLYVLV